MPRFSLLLGLMAFAIASAAPGAARAGWSFDTGLSPEQAADLLAGDTMLKAPEGSWLRLHGMDQSAVVNAQGKEEPLYPQAKPEASVADRRAALRRLRAQGYRLVALLAWDEGTWGQGVRDPKSLRQLPLDLREAFARCRLLAATYGDLIDYWEIGNEPDISFVEENAETYAAYLKACYLGVRRGCADALSGGRRTEGGEQGAAAFSAQVTQNPKPKTQNLTPSQSGALMGALALPPGPWFEAFASNDGLRYTDGFNYHYYGYAEDFTGVYEQFRDAVAELGGLVAVSGGQVTEDGGQRAGSTDSMFATNFYPDAEGWAAKTVATFEFPPQAATPARTLLEKRPLASGEPALVPQGRWLVSPGVTVEETAEGWRFHVATWAPQPMRPAMAELPLPAGWRAGQDALLTFEYRLAAGDGQRAVGGEQKAVGSALSAEGQRQSENRGVTRANLSSSILDLQSRGAGLAPGHAHGATRELPVFLTEYGYGLLSKEARMTAEGRERQRSWFAAVTAQIRQIGINGAMAFLLTPYLEQDTSEFGLLMNGPSAKGEGLGAKSEERRAEDATPSVQLLPLGALPFARAGARWGGYTVSPALATLLEEEGGRRTACRAEALGQRREDSLSRHSSKSDGGRTEGGGHPSSLQGSYDETRPAAVAAGEEGGSMLVADVASSPVVIDFVGGQGLAPAKTSGGYFLQGNHGRGQPAEGLLVVYNFGDKAARGELVLEGDAWTLADGGRRTAFELAPGDRRETGVRIAPPGNRFVAHRVRAIWREADLAARKAESGGRITVDEQVEEMPLQAAVTRPAGLVSKRVRPDTPERREAFEMYFRTLNGNLYATWPRLTATGQWARYMERMGNFSMAFYGRANPPWRFKDNEPGALVFFFRPAALPATFEIRGAQVAEFSEP